MATRHRVRGAQGRFVPGRGGRPSTTGSAGGTFRDTLTPGIGAHGPVVVAAVHREMRAWAQDALAYMRANAPWTDRTGDARAGLGFAIDEGLTEATVTLYHSVSYGVWLEIALGGRYAIIVPTIETMGPQLMHRLEAML